MAGRGIRVGEAGRRARKQTREDGGKGKDAGSDGARGWVVKQDGRKDRILEERQR